MYSIVSTYKVSECSLVCVSFGGPLGKWPKLGVKILSPLQWLRQTSFIVLGPPDENSAEREETPDGSNRLLRF